MIRRYTAAILIAGAVVLGGAITTMAATGSLSVAAKTATTISQTAGLDINFGGIGRGHDGFGGLTVTAINGSTISATDHDGQTVTILVGTSTTYAEAGATASLSDIHVGSRIAVKSATTGASATMVTAASVTILLPTTEGTVSAVSGDTITVRLQYHPLSEGRQDCLAGGYHHRRLGPCRGHNQRRHVQRTVGDHRSAAS
jgi:hypothetical protein